jgi:hypothetical protein
MSVVLGYTTSDYLMLDADNKRPDVARWAEKYARKNELGTTLIMLTSDKGQYDLFGNRLYNFAIIFGDRLPWQEIMVHIGNALKAKIVDKKFVKMRFQGFITERINKKNNQVLRPKIFRYITPKKRKKGDNEGCFEYLKWWIWYKKALPTQTKMLREIMPSTKEGFSPLLSPMANKINIQKARKKLRHNAEDEDDNDDPFTVTDFEAIENLDVESHLLTMLSASLKLSFRRKLTDYVV